MSRFTDMELAIAKSVDLVAVASHMGYTPKKIGKYYTLKEMDSIRIYNRSHWVRWSMKDVKGENGGSQIDFLRVFGGMDVKEAVFWLLDFAGYVKPDESKSSCRVSIKKPELKNQITKSIVEEVEKKEFILPSPAKNNSYLYRYLSEERCLRMEVINFFVKKNLIYESEKYHNIVFKGNDKDGVTRFASMRGVFDSQGKPFKCDVEGNDKNYGFNIYNDDSTEVVVFEAAIDLMSYVDIFDDFYTNKVALGMLGDAPLLTFLREHSQIKTIRFCLDNDTPGRRATLELMEKYKRLGYEVINSPAPVSVKDYNEWLISEHKKNEKQVTETIVSSNSRAAR